MSAPEISVVMPAHDEALLLESSVRDVAIGLESTGTPFEVVVVENGSRDATRDIAVRLTRDYREVRLESLPRADYGAALRAGILAATGSSVVVFDVDYYDLEFLHAAVNDLGAGPSAPVIVVGSKRAAGARDERPWYRRTVTAVLALLLRIGFGLRVSDTHGMKAMRRVPVEPVVRRCRSGRELFDTELVLRCERAGLGVAERPVTVRERRPSRTPIWRRIPRTLIGLVGLRIILWRDRPRSEQYGA
ncbi:MAG: glycosyltransferase family 2 protein [Acidimicrobiia bacterium]